MGAMNDNKDRRQRQLEQTILAEKVDQHSRATLIAVKNALKTAKIEPIIDAWLAGDPPELPPTRRPIDLDEDLSGALHDSQ